MPMDLRFSPEDVAFREEVRTFFQTEVPLSIRRKVIGQRSSFFCAHCQR